MATAVEESHGILPHGLAREGEIGDVELLQIFWLRKERVERTDNRYSLPTSK